MVKPSVTVISTYLFLVEAAERILFVILPYYLIARGFSALEAGTIYSIASIFLVLSRFFLGKLSDVVGRKQIMVVGSFLSSVATALYPLASSFKQFVLVKSLKDVGNNIASSVFDAIQADEFEGRMRKRYIRIVGTVYPLGRAAGVVLGFVISTYLAYTHGFWIAAILLFTATFIFATFYNPSKNVKPSGITKKARIVPRINRRIVAPCIAALIGSVAFTMVYHPSFFFRAEELGIMPADLFATMFFTYVVAALIIDRNKERIERSDSRFITIAGLVLMGVITLFYTTQSALFFLTVFFFMASTYYVWRIGLKDYLYASSVPSRRGEELGFVKMIEGVGGIVGPAVGGVIMVKAGAPSLFIVAFMIYVVGAFFVLLYGRDIGSSKNI